MKIYSFYDLSTGIVKRRLSLPQHCDPAAYVREGEGFVVGALDHLSQKVDVKTGAVVDYQPPQPDADHEWNAERKRWVKRADVLEREAAARRTQARIDELERRGHRPLRELQLDPFNEQARQVLAEIDLQIRAARAALRALVQPPTAPRAGGEAEVSRPS